MQSEDYRRTFDLAGDVRLVVYQDGSELRLMIVAPNQPRRLIHLTHLEARHVGVALVLGAHVAGEGR